MREKDLAIGGLVVLGLAMLGKKRGPRMVVSVPEDEIFQKKGDTYTRPKGYEQYDSTGPKGPANAGSSSSSSSKPAPIPNVPQDASTPGLEKILVSTAEAVLWKLGANELNQDGVFDLDVAKAWQEAALLVIGPSANGAFERADNERAWVDPKVADRLLEFANAGHRPLDPGGEPTKADEGDDGSPPPMPDVETPSPNPSYQAVNVDTAQRVLIALGADVARDGVFNFPTQDAWKRAAAIISPGTDPAFERASNTRAWVLPATAAALAKAANEGRKPFAEASDAGSAAARAAQAAARGQGERDDAGTGDNLTVQEPVPAIPLPNPPPTPINLERARQTAPKVDKEIKAKRDKYSRALVKQFQEDAGLVGDGLYGPVTQSALKYFGVRDPARPIFKNKTYTAYQPPPGA